MKELHHKFQMLLMVRVIFGSNKNLFVQRTVSGNIHCNQTFNNLNEVYLTRSSFFAEPSVEVSHCTFCQAAVIMPCTFGGSICGKCFPCRHI